MQEQIDLFNAFFRGGDLVVVATATLFLFVLGACVASFSCLVAYRLKTLPDDRPLVAAISSPPSACDHCRRRLSPLDLVPVLGWILARGRCRTCGGAVPARYPAMEAVLGAACAAAPFLFGGLTAQCAAAVFVACVGFLAAAIDWENSIVPEEITWTLLFAGLLASPFEDDVATRIAGAATGAFLVWFSMSAIGWWKRIDTRAIGDVAMGAAGGAWLGLQPVSWWLFAACMVHIALCLFAAEEDAEAMTWVPFGPALMSTLAAALVVVAALS